jgi:DNA-binding protein YbaB
VSTVDLWGIRVTDEFERLVAEFDKFQNKLKKVDAQLGNVADLQAEITAIEASVTSTDRSITVVAGPGGSIKDIRFTEDALRQRPHTLSAEVMATVRQAVAEAARKQASVVDRYAGGMQVLDQVLQTQAEVFGTTVDSLDAASDPAVPEEAQPEDDRSGFTLMRDPDQSRPTPPPSPPASGPSRDPFLKNLYGDEDAR